jgi:GH18 family chitinase
MKNTILLFLILSAGSGLCQQSKNNKSSSKTPEFMVIGYLPGRSIDTTTIQFDKLTHINFSFAIPAKNGGGLDAIRKLG